VQARIARELGVSEATISRDVRAFGHVANQLFA
jgi:DNA-binding MurR/RpiR family transcriptional regulator